MNSSLGKSSKPSALHLDGLHLMQVKQIQCHCRKGIDQWQCFLGCCGACGNTIYHPVVKNADS